MSEDIPAMESNYDWCAVHLRDPSPPTHPLPAIRILVVGQPTSSAVSSSIGRTYAVHHNSSPVVHRDAVPAVHQCTAQKTRPHRISSVVAQPETTDVPRQPLAKWYCRRKLQKLRRSTHSPECRCSMPVKSSLRSSPLLSVTLVWCARWSISQHAHQKMPGCEAAVLLRTNDAQARSVSAPVPTL